MVVVGWRVPVPLGSDRLLLGKASVIEKLFIRG